MTSKARPYHALLLCLSLLAATSAHPTPLNPVRIEGQSSCATGISIGEGFIITNAHVTRSLCRLGTCLTPVTIRDRNEERIFPSNSHKTLTLIREVPSVDLSILSIDGIRTPPRLEVSPPIQGEAVTVVGFPRCEAVNESRGVITSVTPPLFETDAPVAKGSSGSVVLGLDGKLRGIITSVSSVPSAITATFLGSDGRGSAISSEAVNRALLDSDLELLHWELRTALNHFDSFVRPENGVRRWMRSLRFLGFVEGITVRAPGADPTGDVVRALLWGAVDDISVVSKPSTPSTEIGHLAEELALTYLWEYGGPYGTILSTPPSEVLRALRAIRGNDPSLVSIAERVKLLEGSSFRGFVIESLKYGLLGFCVFIFWLLSVGFVLGRAPSVISGVIHVTLVGMILWPLSFLLYLWWHRRAR